MRRLPSPIILVTLFCLLAACAAPSKGELTAEAATSTPSPAPTRTPRPTVTPTVAPSATPDVALYDDGAWLLFQGSVPNNDEVDSHLWAVNWDGTGLTDLLPHFWVWRYALQPLVDGVPGRYVAAITSYGWSDRFMLTIVRLPDEEIEAIIPLTNPQTILIDKTAENEVEALRRASASYAISDLRSLAWSPEGRRVAFSGAQDGTQADVYVYSLDDRQVLPLTWQQHRNHASSLIWSPDGKYVAFEDTSISGLETYATAGVWLAYADGSGAKQLTTSDGWVQIQEGRNLSYGVYLWGWTSDHTVAVNGVYFDVWDHVGLTSIDVRGRTTLSELASLCESEAYDPQTDTWLIVIPGNLRGGAHEPGTYLVHNGLWKRVGDPVSPSVRYWPGKSAFVTAQGVLSSDGEWNYIELPSLEPSFSPDGVYWAFPEHLDIPSLNSNLSRRLRSEWDGLWIGQAGHEPRQITDLPLEVVQWSADSRSVLLRHRYEPSQYIAISPDFELQRVSHFENALHLGPWLYGEAIDE